jgi:hypothetical protein
MAEHSLCMFLVLDDDRCIVDDVYYVSKDQAQYDLHTQEYQFDTQHRCWTEYMHDSYFYVFIFAHTSGTAAIWDVHTDWSSRIFG